MAGGTEIGKGYVGVSADTKNLQSDLTSLGSTLGAKMGPVGAVLGNKLGSSMGTEMQSSLGGSQSGVGKLVGLLGKGGPWGMAAEAAVASAAVVGTALYKMGSDFESQYRTIARNTGATGKDLDNLKVAFKDVASHSSASFEQVGTAISEVQRYTGPTGAGLEKLSGQMLTLSRITGTDVKTNTEAAVHALENWNVAQKDAPRAMDELFVASQKSGVGFATLAQQVTQFAPQMRTMGFSFADSTAMLATFGKTGANTPRIMAAMQLGATKIASENAGASAAVDKAREAVEKANAAMTKAKPGSQGAADAAKKLADAHKDLKQAEEDQAASAGKTVPQAFAESVKAIRDSTDQTDALNKASELFGSRGAAQMVDAIKSGKFNFDEMKKSVKDSNDSISETGSRTKTLGGSFSKLKNATKVALEPLSTATFNGINRGLLNMMNGITPLVTWFGNNLPGAISHTVNAFKDAYKWIDAGVRSIYESTTPLRHMIGETFTVMARLISDAYAIIQPIIRAIKDIFTVIIDLLRGDWGGAWNAAKDAVMSALRALANIPKMLFDYITAPFAAIGPGVADALHGFWDTVSAIPGKVIGFLVNLGSDVFNAISSGFSTAWDAATGALVTFWAMVTNIPTDIINTLAGLGAAVWGALSGGFSQAINGAANGISALWGWVAGIGGAIVGWLGDVGTKIWGYMSHAFGRVKDGAVDGIQTLWGWAQGIGGRIVSAIGDAGTDLYNKGRHIIDRFGQGIKDAFAAVGGIVSGGMSKIRGLFPGSPAKEGPFSGRGWTSLKTGGSAIMKQVAAGVNAEASMLTRTINLALPDLPTMTGGTTARGAAQSYERRSGPAVVIQSPVFRETIDVQSVMKQVTWSIETAGL